MADWEISQGQPGDEDSFALIQTESWKAAFRDILTPEVLENATQLPKAVSMYRRLYFVIQSSIWVMALTLSNL